MLNKLINHIFIISIAYFVYHGALAITGISDLSIIVGLIIASGTSFESNVGRKSSEHTG